MAKNKEKGKTDAVICPGCGMDVAEVGFRTIGEYSTTWMRVGKSVVQVGTDRTPAVWVACAHCAEKLADAPVEMLRKVA